MRSFSKKIASLVLNAITVFDANHRRRRRRWGPRATFLGLLVLVGSRMRLGYTGMIEYVFDQWGETLGWTRKPAISGFSAARSTITARQCRQAWEQAVRFVEDSLPADRRPGAPGGRIVCIDGSWVVAPATAGTRKRWGRITKTKGNGDTPNPQALVVTGWELRSRMPIGCSILDEDEGEREGAHRVIDGLAAGDLVLMDRGFPSDRLLGHLLDRGIDFVIRMPSARQRCWREVRAFLDSGSKDAVVPVEVVGKNGIARIVNLRLIRRTFSRGRPRKGQTREEMVLATTLLDTQEWSAERIIGLYRQRWAVETAYKEMKVDFRIEEFHSVTPERIEQERYALLTWLTFMAFIELGAEAALVRLRGPQDLEDPCRYQISRSLLHHITLWTFCDFIAGGQRWEERRLKLDRHFENLAREARRKRPGRSAPRQRSRPFGRFRATAK